MCSRCYIRLLQPSLVPGSSALNLFTVKPAGRALSVHPYAPLLFSHECRFTTRHNRRPADVQSVLAVKSPISAQHIAK